MDISTGHTPQSVMSVFKFTLDIKLTSRDYVINHLYELVAYSTFDVRVCFHYFGFIVVCT